MTMPEEINRLVTDRLNDLLLTPDELSSANLRSEGVTEDRIRFVDNIMIDTLKSNRSKTEELKTGKIIKRHKGTGALCPRFPTESSTHVLISTKYPMKKMGIVS